MVTWVKMMKQCTKCSIIKDIQFFQKEKKGYRSQCKQCRCLQKKEDNIKKGGKIDINLIKMHLEKANNFSAQVKEGELRGPPKVLTTNLS